MNSNLPVERDRYKHQATRKLTQAENVAAAFRVAAKICQEFKVGLDPNDDYDAGWNLCAQVLSDVFAEAAEIVEKPKP